AAPPCPVSRLHEQRLAAFPDRELHVILDNLNTHKRALAQETPQSPFPFHPNAVVVAQSDRNMVLNPAGPIPERRLFHRRRAVAGAYRCFLAAYNETAEPFAWTKKKVYQRPFKNRRITQL